MRNYETVNAHSLAVFFLFFFCTPASRVLSKISIHEIKVKYFPTSSIQQLIEQLQIFTRRFNARRNLFLMINVFSLLMLLMEDVDLRLCLQEGQHHRCRQYNLSNDVHLSFETINIGRLSINYTTIYHLIKARTEDMRRTHSLIFSLNPFSVYRNQ